LKSQFEKSAPPEALTVVQGATEDLKKSNLSYPILYGQGNTFASQMGLVLNLSEDLKKLYTNFEIGLVRFNGDETWQLPNYTGY
jgi:hypothetical protein